MAKARNPRQREQGTIDELPSGALRVRVYAGQDPVTKRRHDLVEVVPAGPKAWDRAEEVRQGFLADIRKRRNPQTAATVDQLLDRYLEQHTGGRRTVEGYRDYIDKHVPALHRQVEGRRDRCRDPRLALCRDAAVPRALPRPPRHRSPDQLSPRVRRAV